MARSSRSGAERLAERGIDAREVLGPGPYGGQVTTGDLYTFLGMVAASEKAGQGPTHTLARLALRAGLPPVQADTLFLAYNQQSAEEAGHGDKVFGAAYYAMGGIPVTKEQSVVGDGEALQGAVGTDPEESRPARLDALPAALRRRGLHCRHAQDNRLPLLAELMLAVRGSRGLRARDAGRAVWRAVRARAALGRVRGQQDLR